MIDNKKVSGLAWILLISLAFIWGSSFILIKKSLVGLSPIQVGALRIFSAFICFIPFYAKGIREVAKSNYSTILLSGLAGNLIPAFLFALAQTKIQSSVSGVLNSLVPIFIVLISVFVFKGRFKKTQILGVIIGFLGCIVLVSLKSSTFKFDFNYYSLIIVVATIFYAISANLIKYKLEGISAIHISSMALLAVGPIAGIVFGATGGFELIMDSEMAMKSACYAILLGAVASAIALVMFNKLLQIAPIIFVSSVTYLIPIVAMAWGLFDGEFLSSYQFAGIGIILVAIVLIKR